MGYLLEDLPKTAALLLLLTRAFSGEGAIER